MRGQLHNKGIYHPVTRILVFHSKSNTFSFSLKYLKFLTSVKAFLLFICCKAWSVPNNLHFHNAVSKKVQDFLIGNIISTAILLRGIKTIQWQALSEKRGLQLKEATSVVCDVHATCKCHSLLSFLVTNEVKHTEKAALQPAKLYKKISSLLNQTCPPKHSKPFITLFTVSDYNVNICR